MSFPGSSVVNNPPANAGHTGNSGSVPGLERSPGGGNGNPLVRGNPLEKEMASSPGGGNSNPL